MKINLEKYDYQSIQENLIDIIIQRHDLSEAIIDIYPNEQHILYILSLMTILYKEYLFNEEADKIIKNTKPLNNYSELNEQIYYIIGQISNAQQNNEKQETLLLINRHGEIIQSLIKRYFNHTRKNYITNKYTNEIIFKNNKVKQLLSLNPYSINQLLKYQLQPMTQEEKIICDIIIYSMIVIENGEINQGNLLEKIKKLMIKNYNEQELQKSIIYIIGNVYQEVMDRKIHELYNEMRYIIENPNNTNEQITQHFINNKLFSNKMLTLFLNFNSKITEERLNELKQAPTYKYIKIRNKP